MSFSINRNVFANYLGQGWSALANLLFIPVYVRFVGVESYGLIAIFAALNSWFTLLDLGMTPTMGRVMGTMTDDPRSILTSRDLLRTIEILAVAAAITTVVATASIAHWISTEWIHVADLKPEVVARAFQIFGLMTSLRFLEGIYKACIAGLNRQVLLNVLSCTFVTLRSVGAVAVLAWAAQSIEAFLVWQTAVSGLAVLSFALVTYSLLPRAKRTGRFSMTAIRSVQTFAGGMTLITGLSLALTQADRVILSRMLSLHDFGIYALATTAAGGLLYLVSPVTTAAYPRLCQFFARADHASFAETFHHSSQLITVLAGSAAIVIIALAPEIMLLWTQDSEISIAAAPLLRCLAAGTLLNCLMWVPYHAQLANAWTSLSVRLNIVAVLVVVPAMIIGVNSYGAIGAAWAWIALNAGYVVFGMRLMFRRILASEQVRWYWDDTGRPLLFGALAAYSFIWIWPSPQSLHWALLRTTTALAFVVLAAATSLPAFRRLLLGRANKTQAGP